MHQRRDGAPALRAAHVPGAASKTAPVRSSYLAFFDPEVQIRQARGMLGTAGDYRGHWGVAEVALEVVRDFSDPVFEPQEIRAAGDQVAVAAVMRGSAAPFEARVGHLFTLGGGRVVRFEVFEDPAAAFRAAGITR
jgi:ketosteroid isomerase-like protein